MRRGPIWNCSAGFQHSDELMRNSFFEIDLLLDDRIRTGGVADSDSIDGEGWVTLLGSIIDGGVHVAVEAVGIAEAKPVQVVLSDAGHEELNDISAIGNLDHWLAVSGRNDPIEGSGDQWVRREGIANDCLDES